MEDANAVIIGADESLESSIKEALAPTALTVHSRRRLASGLKLINEENSVVIVNAVASKGAPSDSLYQLREIKAYYPESYVIVLCPNGSDNTDGLSAKAVDLSSAVKEGAFCILQKPLDPEALRAASLKAVNDLKLRQELNELRRVTDGGNIPYLTGESATVKRIEKAIVRLSASDAPVLICGEAGTGKELVARLIHKGSMRADNPFHAIHATDAPVELLVAELMKRIASLGHKHGTLYIEEITALGPATEEALLDLAKGGKFSFFLDDDEPEGIDIRLIFGTSDVKSSGPISKELKGTTLKLPSLKDRREDILPLAAHFLREAEMEFDTGAKRFSKAAEGHLFKHPWPGNIKELKEAVMRACVLSRDSLIEKKDLLATDAAAQITIRDFLENKLKRYLKDLARLESSNLYDTVMEEVEKSLIEIVLNENKGNQLKTSRAMGMNRNTLRAKVKKYGLNGK